MFPQPQKYTRQAPARTIQPRNPLSFEAMLFFAVSILLGRRFFTLPEPYIATHIGPPIEVDRPNAWPKSCSKPIGQIASVTLWGMKQPANIRTSTEARPDVSLEL